MTNSPKIGLQPQKEIEKEKLIALSRRRYVEFYKLPDRQTYLLHFFFKI